MKPPKEHPWRAPFINLEKNEKKVLQEKK